MLTTLMAMFFAGKTPCHKKTVTIQELKYFESSLIRLRPMLMAAREQNRMGP